MYLYICINWVSACGTLINQPDLQCESVGPWGVEGCWCGLCSLGCPRRAPEWLRVMNRLSHVLKQDCWTLRSSLVRADALENSDWCVIFTSEASVSTWGKSCSLCQLCSPSAALQGLRQLSSEHLLQVGGGAGIRLRISRGGALSHR